PRVAQKQQSCLRHLIPSLPHYVSSRSLSPARWPLSSTSRGRTPRKPRYATMPQTEACAPARRCERNPILKFGQSLNTCASGSNGSPDVRILCLWYGSCLVTFRAGSTSRPPSGMAPTLPLELG